MVLAVMDDEPFALELLEVMSHGIQGDPQLHGQLSRSQRLRALELRQHRAALAFMAGRQAGLDHR
jgi:hypothetical protein